MVGMSYTLYQDEVSISARIRASSSSGMSLTANESL
jgi:hypothetical protein